MPQTMKLALLDDYQKVALQLADWDRLRKRGIDITVFNEPFASVDDAAQKLAPFEILGLLRERTAFPRALIEKLPNLKFMVLTGARAASLDDKAATERGIPISTTPGGGSNAPTAELGWALLMSCARDLAKAERLMRSGGWHDGIQQMNVLEGKRLGILGLGKLGSRVAGYAKAFGMESLDKLKDAIRKSLGDELEEVSRTKVKRQLLDALDGKYAFDLPPSLVEQEFATVWSQVKQDIEARKTTFEAEGSTEAEAQAEYRRIAERRVRLGLVLAEIGEKAGVKITDEEVGQALVMRARQFPGQEKQVWDFYRNNPQAMAEIRAPIFEDKVIDSILAAVKVTNKSVSREELLKVEDEEKAAPKPKDAGGETAEQQG